MPRKDSRNTRMKIINAAWELFYESGYESTTIEDIVERSETSKGTFYHHFNGKDALLSTLSYLFDDKYELLESEIDLDGDAYQTLLMLNKELFFMIENRISLDLLARMYSTQLVTTGDKHLLDNNRTYFKLLRKVIIHGQQNGQLRSDVSTNEILKAYALFERALLYDWCICNGNYSLCNYSQFLLPMFLNGFKTLNS
ncbi:MAG: TetR/AcrR family transcriptional regulator [Clostridia bacterium]|nr:TetR/AcrR family transcriptional regulator [Clostridia bacterium]